MAEESDLERTEAPSQRRLEQAREEGQVPRSRELNTFTLLGAAGVGLWVSADGLRTSFATLLTSVSVLLARKLSAVPESTRDPLVACTCVAPATRATDSAGEAVVR